MYFHKNSVRGVVITGIDPNELIREAQKLRESGGDSDAGARRLRDLAKSSMTPEQAQGFEKLLSDSDAVKRLLESDAAKKLLEGLSD